MRPPVGWFGFIAGVGPGQQSTPPGAAVLRQLRAEHPPETPPGAVASAVPAPRAALIKAGVLWEGGIDEALGRKGI